MKKLLQFSFIIIFGIFSGCINQKKVQKWNDQHPQEAADYSATHFPCKPGDTLITVSVDSSQYLQSIEDLQRSLDLVNNFNDSLLYRLQNIDTGCRQYVSVIDTLKKKIQALQFRVNNVKPKIITNEHLVSIIDSAALVSLRLQNNKLAQTNAFQEKRILILAGHSKTRLWMSLASGILNLLLIVLLFRKKSLPLLK